jgi:hypothetical protein
MGAKRAKATLSLALASDLMLQKIRVLVIISQLLEIFEAQALDLMAM